MTDSDLKTMDANSTESFDGYRGHVLEQGANGTLLFNGGFVQVEPITE